MRRNFTKRIRIKFGDLVTLGYDETTKHDGDYKCIWVGVYKGGNLESCCVKNVIIIAHEPVQNKMPQIGKFNETNTKYDVQEWWRTPTEKDVQLYEYWLKYNEQQ